MMYGWQQRQTADGPVWQPQGVTLGWIEDPQIWLLPDVAVGAVNRLLQQQGSGIPIRKDTLGKRLRDAGRLIEYDEGSHTKRVRIAGTAERTRVWVLAAWDVPAVPPEEFEDEAERDRENRSGLGA